MISAIIALVIIGLLIFAFKADKFDKIIFALIIGGAVGNMIEYYLMLFLILSTFILKNFIGLHLIWQIFYHNWNNLFYYKGSSCKINDEKYKTFLIVLFYLIHVPQ